MQCAEPTPILNENYLFLQKHVYSNTGIVLEEGKHYLFISRLSPIVDRLGLGSINELCAALRQSRQDDLSLQVLEAMTTNETYFFRDPAHYEAICRHLLPGLRELRRDSRNLRCWSAAASTGQEAYSLAMLLVEQGLGDWNIQIMGTDFCSRVLARARAGRYQQIEVNRGLPASRLVKYFTQIGVEWQLRQELRRMALFQQMDLRGDLSRLGTFDLIFCRNVMIYFDAQTRLKLVEQIRGCLTPGGWLLLGAAETSMGIDEWFERRSVENATVYVAK